jgi:iron(III) transport system ATP-binding protein
MTALPASGPRARTVRAVPTPAEAAAFRMPAGVPLPTGTTAPEDNHLVVDKVTKAFGGTEVLRGVSLAVQQGRTTAVVGPSGSGKTTLLRIIAGFEAPDSGSVTLGGRTVATEGVLVPAHRRNIGYVAQDGALFPHLSVGENVAFGLERKALARRGQSAKARVAELLGMVSLDPDFARRRPDQLSGGQQQRVALARALAREPELMLLDEPFSALDAGLRVATRKAVARTLAEAGCTTILVTHDQGEALSFADQVAVMRHGMLAQVGNPFIVYTRPKDRETAEFLGDAVILDADLQGTLATCALGAIPVRRPTCQGKVQLMLRPEQIRITGSGPIHGTVLETDFFGPEVTVRIRLHGATGGSGGRDGLPDDGQTITIRHWNAMMARPGSELYLRVVGEAVAFPV